MRICGRYFAMTPEPAPGAPQLIANRPELSDATEREILGGGARRFYGLT